MNRRSWSCACAALVTVASLAWLLPARAQEEPPFRPGPGSGDGRGTGGDGGPMGSGPGGDGAGHFFETLDANHDGAVTEEEVVRFARDRFRDAVTSGDVNRDRKLTKAEFDQAARTAHQGTQDQGDSDGGRSRPPTSDELFRTFDANHDGRLTAAEMPEPHRRNIVTLLANLGRSPDGYLTPKDFDRLNEGNRDHPPEGGGAGSPGGALNLGAGAPPGPGPGSEPGGGEDRPDPDLMFRMVDRNRDGRVDRNEAEMAPPGPRAGMLMLLNRHGLTSITKAEFKALVGPMTQASTPGGPGGAQPDPLKNLDLVFENCDRNKDGRLTLVELEGTDNDKLKEIIQKLGKTETGISKAEIRELASHAPRGPGGARGAPDSGPPGGAPSTPAPGSGTGPR